jgi:hypothetical protein
MHASVMLIIVLAALVVVLAAALGKAPLWVAVFLLVVAELITLLPVR